MRTQTCIPPTERRVAGARRPVAGREIVVAVDGGITKATVERVASLGVDLIVADSAVHDGVSAADNARVMLEALRRARAELAMAGVTKEGE